jgi:hypothetical protein
MEPVMKWKNITVLVDMLFLMTNLPALDVWQYPEPAGPYSIFLDIKPSELFFREGFRISPPEAAVDFLLPFGIPVSAGAFLKAPELNIKSFGLRAGYHINLDDEKTDLYALYVIDLGFTLRDLLARYGDAPEPAHYFDVRIGVRRLIGKFIGLSLESTFKFRGISLGLSIKLQ